MGYLWENAEKMDIQLERRLRAEAEKKVEEAEQRAEQRAAQKVAEKVAEKEEIGIKAVIELGRQPGEDKSGLCKILKDKLQISEERATEAVEKYWE